MYLVDMLRYHDEGYWQFTLKTPFCVGGGGASDPEGIVLC